MFCVRIGTHGGAVGMECAKVSVLSMDNAMKQSGLCNEDCSKSFHHIDSRRLWGSPKGSLSIVILMKILWAPKLSHPHEVCGEVAKAACLQLSCTLL